jgi:integrase
LEFDINGSNVEHQRPTLVLLASRWKPQKHKNGSICKTAADASKPEAFLAGVEIQSLYNKPEDFVFPSERLQGIKPLDLASVLKKRIQPAFRRIGITGVGRHTFRHSVGTMLAEMGEHQLTIRDYLRHSNLHVTNKYLQATSKTKRLAQDKLVDAILPTGILPKTNLIQ